MTDIREALSSAFDKADTSETSPPPMETGTPVEALADDTPPPGELPTEAAPEPTAPTQTAATPAKDPKTGQFLKRTVPPPSAPVAKPPPPVGAPQGVQTTPPPTESPKPTPPAVKAPQSWKPEVREKWAALPPEVQQEVARREKEVAAVLQESAAARKAWDGFREVVSPYEGMIRAEGGDPLRAVGSLLQTAAALRTASPAHKAKLVANIVQQYGVPVEALDAALSGQTPPPSAQQQAPALDPEVILQQAEQRVLRNLQTRQQQVIQEKARQDTEAFIASGEAEFLDDVRDLMANMLDSAARSGMNLSLKDAYNRACALHPGVSQALEQRKAAQTATVTQAAAQKARAAASSVKTRPAAPPSAEAPTDIRSILEQQWTRASGR